MEDIEYLEEYEDLILPKTLNYSEDFPINAVEGELIEEADKTLSPGFQADVPNSDDNFSICSSAKDSKTNRTNLINIINTEVLTTSIQIQNDNKESTLVPAIMPISLGKEQAKIRYDREKTSFLDRINHNPVLQNPDKYKNVATVKPTLKKTASSLNPPFMSTDTKKQKIMSEDVNSSYKEFQIFQDYGVEKHGGDDFNLVFNFNSPQMSDICSDSANCRLSKIQPEKQLLETKLIIANDLNEDIFLESLLSSEIKSKKKLKRKHTNYPAEVVHKKTKYGTNSISLGLLKKQDNGMENGSTKDSVNQKHHKTNAEKKKSQISFEKKIINSNGKKSKLIVKKNGKKFVFPDRSKFSLKNLNNSNNVNDEHKETSTTICDEVVQTKKTIPFLVETNVIKTPVETQREKPENVKLCFNHATPENEKKDHNLEKIVEEEKIIFSSPKNMKRIDPEIPIPQDSPTTPSKSTGLTFEHFSLKLTKSTNNLKITSNSDTLPHSPSNMTSESDKSLDTPDKNNVDIPQEHESLENSSEMCNKKNENNEHNKLVSNCNKINLLQTSDNVVDSSIDKNDIPLIQVSNDLKEKTNVENINNEIIRADSFEIVSNEADVSKTSLISEKIDDITSRVEENSKSLSEIVSKEISDKQSSLEQEADDLLGSVSSTKSSTEEAVEKTITNTTNIHSIPNFILNKVNETNKNSDNVVQDNSSLEEDTDRGEFVENSNKIINASVSTDVNLMHTEEDPTKILDSPKENKTDSQISSADQVAAESSSAFSKNKVIVEVDLPTTSLNKKKVKRKKQNLAHFETRGFDVRLSKSIVSKLLKTQSIKPKTLDETNKLPKPVILNAVNNNVDSTSLCISPKKSTLSIEPTENGGAKIKGKRGRRKKNAPQISSVQSSKKASPLKLGSTENIISNEMCPFANESESLKKGNNNNCKFPSDLSKEKIPSPQKTLNLSEDISRCSPKEKSFSGKVAGIEELPPILGNEPKVVFTTSGSQSSEKKDEVTSSPKKKTRQIVHQSKDNSQPKPNEEISLNLKDKVTGPRHELTPVANSVGLVDNKISNQTPVQQKSTKNLCDIESIEPKKELNEEAVVLQFRPTNLLTNDSFLNKIKLSENPDFINNKTSSDLNTYKNSIETFGNEQINQKFTTLELPAYIVMRTKIISRKDLETNKTLVPAIIKQQTDTDTENSTIEPVVKAERPEFNSICAQINSLLEQNANYLKFASGSERLTRMNDVLGDYSLSIEDAKCTLKFLTSYLSSSSRDRSIKTRGQQFIPIYDSQKKIIGYRKRTIHAKPLSSRRSSKRITRVNASSTTSVTTDDINSSVQIIQNNTEISPKIEPGLLDDDDIELIVPDTSPVNNVCIKNEEDLLEKK